MVVFLRASIFWKSRDESKNWSKLFLAMVGHVICVKYTKGKILNVFDSPFFTKLTRQSVLSIKTSE